MVDYPRVTQSSELHGGDVVTLATEQSDRTTGEKYWWKRIACVVETPKPYRNHVRLLHLKMHVDLDKDMRLHDIRTAVVKKIPEDLIPQGPVALRMKYIALGVIEVDTSHLT